MNFDAGVFVPLLLGAGVMGFFTAVVSVLASRRNLRADTAQKISDASGDLIQQFRRANAELDVRLRRCERILRVTRPVTEAMLDELESLGSLKVPEYRRRLDEAEEYTANEVAILLNSDGQSTP